MSDLAKELIREYVKAYDYAAVESGMSGYESAKTALDLAECRLRDYGRELGGKEGAAEICAHVRDNAAGICGTCEPEAMKLHLFAARVVAGFKAWASDEDGVHYQAWDAYQEARQLAGLKPAMTGDEEGASDGE